MGEQRVSKLNSKKNRHQFFNSLLNDVKALQYMIDNDWFEKGITRIGAEQEMVLVDNKTFKPKTNAMEALDILKKHSWVETELAKFNLEINLNPLTLKDKCFSQLEKETTDKLSIIKKKIKKLDTSIVLTGILPTLVKTDLDLVNLTPKKRYYALMESINQQLSGTAYELKISGIDDLKIKHDSPLLEASNTSFQVHLQVEADKFVGYYNIAQALAGPCMAIAANSPLVFGKRLWHESRIAMFQQALDTRTTHDHMRESSPRVNFGDDWLKESILEIYKEDIAQFKPLISPDIQEESLDMINANKVPKLAALQVHNSTVYRWNRPCYGISPNGKPHLRIENRVLPSGPTIVDEVANACFWIGAMEGMYLEYGDNINNLMHFEDVRDNFMKGAQFGIDTTFNWIGDKKISATKLIVKKLIPLAEKGLRAYKVSQKDIDKYLGIIKARAKNHSNGARWLLRGYTSLTKETSKDEALTVLTHCIIKNQATNVPVHKWPAPSLNDLDEYKPGKLKVSEFMDTNLLTVSKSDILEFAINLMEWKDVRYLPVERKGKLQGLISSKMIMNHLATTKKSEGKFTTVKDVMTAKPHTVSPDTGILDAMKIMKKNNVGCLPVVSKGELMGVITENHYMNITDRLMERLKKEKETK